MKQILSTSALAIVLLAGASGAALAQDRDHERGGQQAQPQGHPAAQPAAPPGGGHPGGPPGGGEHHQGAPPSGSPQGAPAGGNFHHEQAPGGQPAGPPRGQPGFQGDRFGRDRFQGGQAQAPAAQPPAVVNSGQRGWDRGDRGRTEVTPPQADGRHDPRGGDHFSGRGPDGRGPDGRGPDGRGDGRGFGDRRDRHNFEAWGGRPGGPAPRWTPGHFPPVMTWNHDRFRAGFYRPPPGYYYRAWGFGEYLPRPWFARDYWLEDFLDFDLPYPPPGFVWVRVGPDVLMIDQFNGRIVQVVHGIFW